MSDTPTHAVSWALDACGQITPSFTCHAPPGSPCLHGTKFCSVEAYLGEEDEPMSCYAPHDRADRAPSDGPIDVWLNRHTKIWHWAYPAEQAKEWAS